VFGFGCLPGDAGAVLRILALKRRDPAQGLVLIAAYAGQLEGWIAPLVDARELTSSELHPVSYIVPASRDVPYWIRGNTTGLAVLITRHPVAAALCYAADSPLVSTSANVGGRPPARNAWVLRRQFRKLVDCIVPGRCGPARGPSEIRDLVSGRILRPAST
jgi:L-threonylcarbamoyladenylate synthase